jgi:hypothetical protein
MIARPVDAQVQLVPGFVAPPRLDVSGQDEMEMHEVVALGNDDVPLGV